MWVIVMFDLPMKTSEERLEYQHFRNLLLKDGFLRMQYSVYMRFCPSQENAEAHLKRVKSWIPPEGEVRIFLLTAKQFEKMKIYHGKMRKEPEKEPPQLLLF
jgi:CRISPR-associated protein Cas2